MLEIIKSNIKPIILFFVIVVILAVFNIKLSCLSKENSDLKNQITSKEKTIEQLEINLAKSDSIIKEQMKQRKIEDELITKTQEFEVELNQCKEETKTKLTELTETDENVKNWCEQPIPYNVSSMFDELYKNNI